MTNPAVDYAKSELERLTREIKRLSELRDTWQNIVRLEQTQVSVDVTHLPQQTGGPQLAPTPLATAALDEGNYGWRINALRDIFRANGTGGMKPSEVWRIVQDKGISDRQGFVYSTLARLLKQGQMTKKRGKYYPTPLMFGEETEKGSAEALPISA